jgi:glucose-6-phosphate 1-dehydrogenase
VIRTLLLLGATGDVARRYVLPALGALHAAGRLPDGFRIVGAARGELDEEGVRRLAGDVMPAHMFAYRAVDLAEPSSIGAALGATREPAVIYLALPPAVFATTIESLAEVGLPPGSRVAIEKPFGDGLKSARELNALLVRTRLDAYRVDHVLGMETVQTLVALRGRGRVLERLWDGGSVHQVDIHWEETLALEGRAGFYDHAGALKDVLQNHMLQLLALVGMSPLEREADLHGRKLAALRSARVVEGSRRARYTAGTLADGREVPSYAEEDGVDAARCTETFVEAVLELDDRRWKGTRFVLRAGKALAHQRKLVLLRFRDGSELELGIDGPTDIVLRTRGAGRAPVELFAPGRSESLPAYAHVLQDILTGGSARSVGGEEAEEAWRVVAPIVAAWEAGEVPLGDYSAGSAGPWSEGRSDE